jgi:MFS family permease
VDSVEAGWLASLVLAGAAVGTLAGGFLDDLLRRAAARHGRRWLGAVAFTLAAGLVGLGLLCESPRALAACASLSCLAAMCTQSSWWSCAIEISGRHIGSLFGLMNGMGVFGAMGSQFFFGAFADWRKGQGYTGRAQWDPAFAVYIAALLAAALCWALYVSRPVAKGEGPADNGEVRDERTTRGEGIKVKEEGIRTMEEGLLERKKSGRGDDAARNS